MPHPFPYIPISSAMPHPRQQPRPLTPLPTPFSQRLSSGTQQRHRLSSGTQWRSTQQRHQRRSTQRHTAAHQAKP
ncbi:unnamed protein product, partial [Ilex paraguariensis]